jgi:hypothetical protein
LERRRQDPAYAGKLTGYLPTKFPSLRVTSRHSAGTAELGERRRQYSLLPATGTWPRNPILSRATFLLFSHATRLSERSRLQLDPRKHSHTSRTTIDLSRVFDDIALFLQPIILSALARPSSHPFEQERHCGDRTLDLQAHRRQPLTFSKNKEPRSTASGPASPLFITLLVTTYTLTIL